MPLKSVPDVKRRVMLVAVALLAVTVAGCLSDDGKRVPLGEGEKPSASAMPSPSFATDDPVQALLGWRDAMYQAERSLDPNHPGLTKYGQGPVLADIRKRIASFRAQGVRLDKPDIVTQPRIIASGVVGGKQVKEVAVCLSQPANSFVDVKSGKPRAPKEASAGNVALTTKFVGVMVLMPDGWRIDGNQLEDVDSCEAIR